MEIETTLSQEWSRNSIQRPQCAFELSMFMCPAVHKLTRNLLRSSSTHEPSDPPFRVVIFNYGMVSLDTTLTIAMRRSNAFHLQPPATNANTRNVQVHLLTCDPLYQTTSNTRDL